MSDVKKTEQELIKEIDRLSEMDPQGIDFILQSMIREVKQKIYKQQPRQASELRFATEEEALQYLADKTGKRVKIADRSFDRAQGRYDSMEPEKIPDFEDIFSDEGNEAANGIKQMIEKTTNDLKSMGYKDVKITTKAPINSSNVGNDNILYEMELGDSQKTAKGRVETRVIVSASSPNFYSNDNEVNDIIVLMEKNLKDSQDYDCEIFEDTLEEDIEKNSIEAAIYVYFNWEYDYGY